MGRDGREAKMEERRMKTEEDSDERCFLRKTGVIVLMPSGKDLPLAGRIRVSGT